MPVSSKIDLPTVDASKPVQFRKWLFAVGLCALTLFVYRPAWNAGFIWDDDRYVTNNPLLTAPDGLWRIWFSLDAPSQYFPLSYTLLRVERFFWGLNPAGYHWLNILIHCVNALLVWRLLCRLNVPGPKLAATIFALHPIQVESVAWISEVKNLLMGLFFLLTLLAWVEFVDAKRGQWALLYTAALLCCFLSLAAKSTACVLPAALVLVLWWKEKPIDRRAIFAICPFAVLALAAGLIAVWWEQYHQGTVVLVSLPLLERVLIASRAVWFYLSKIFWPSDLTFIYPQWKIDVSDPTAYCWLGLTAVAIALIFFGRRLLGRGVPIAFLFFVATLSPLLGFIMLYTFRYTYVADHYQYIACIGPIALISAVLVTAMNAIENGRWIGWSTALATVLGLSALTFRLSATYHDVETLWRATIAKDPGSWIGYNNLGVVESGKGNVEKAIDDYKRSIQLHPDYPEALYNLGGALLQKGEIDRAIELCQQALKLQPADADAHVVLGNALMLKHDIDQAIIQYREALNLHPNDQNAQANLALALQQQVKDQQTSHVNEPPTPNPNRP